MLRKLAIVFALLLSTPANAQIPYIGSIALTSGVFCSSQAIVDDIGSAFAQGGDTLMIARFDKYLAERQCYPFTVSNLQTTLVGQTYWHGAESVTVVGGQFTIRGDTIVVFHLLAASGT